MPITAETITFGIAVFGAIAGLWWRVEARIEGAKTEARASASDLAAYKIHVAEHYVTKDGLREQIAAVISGINELKAGVARISDRVDSFVDDRRPTRRRTGAPE